MNDFRPEFWYIPTIVSDHSDIHPFDEKVYAVIHWFYRMKEGKCTASNDTLATIIKPNDPQPRSVQNSLNNLEKCGFIERFYKDKSRRHRKEIVPLVAYRLERSGYDTRKQSEVARTLERSGDDSQNGVAVTRTRTSDIEKKQELVSSFDSFWKTYPRKAGKPAALRAWSKLKPNKSLTEKISKAIEAWETTKQWKADGGQFIPHPATFLNQRRWEDAPVVEDKKPFFGTYPMKKINEKWCVVVEGGELKEFAGAEKEIDWR